MSKKKVVPGAPIVDQKLMQLFDLYLELSTLCPTSLHRLFDNFTGPLAKDALAKFNACAYAFEWDKIHEELIKRIETSRKQSSIQDKRRCPYCSHALPVAQQ